MKKYLHHKYHHHHLFTLFLLVALASLSLLSTQIKTPEKQLFLTFGVTGQVTVDDQSSEVKIEDLDSEVKDSQNVNSVNVKIADYKLKAKGEDVKVEKIITELSDLSDKTISGLIRFITTTQDNIIQPTSITFTIRASVKSVEEQQREAGEMFLVTNEIPSVSTQPTVPQQSTSKGPTSTTYNDYSETAVQREVVLEPFKRYNSCPESNNPQIQKAMKLTPQFVKTDAKNLVQTAKICDPRLNIDVHIQSFCAQFKLPGECPQQWLYQGCISNYNVEKESLKKITVLCTLSSDGVSRPVISTTTGTPSTPSTGTSCPAGKVKSGSECVCYTGVEQPDVTCSQVTTGSRTAASDCPSRVSLSLSGSHVMITAADGKLTGRRIIWKGPSGEDLSPSFVATVNVNGFDDRHFSIPYPNKDVIVEIPDCGLVASLRASGGSATPSTPSTQQDPCAEKGGVYDASLGGCKCTSQKPALTESGCKTCQEACSAEGLLSQQPNYMPFVQNKLNSAEGYCKKSAHIDFPEFKNYLDHTEKKVCTCYKNENPVVTISPETIVCTGTPCGNVPCDKQVTSGTTTCYCKFSGWECSQTSCSSSTGSSQEYASTTPPSGGTGSGTTGGDTGGSSPGYG